MHSLYVKNRRSIGQAVRFAVACFRLLGSRFDVLEADHIPYFQVLVLRVVTTLRRKRLVVTWHEVWGKSYWRQYPRPRRHGSMADRVAGDAHAGPHHRRVGADCG